MVKYILKGVVIHMSKLVDKDRLAKLAAGLDARMKAAVKAEEERAKGVEEGLQGQIDAMKSSDTGILAEAKKYADEEDAKIEKALADEKDDSIDGSLANKIKNEVAAREDADELLDGRVAALESFKNAQPGIDEDQNNRLTALENKDTAHETRMKNIEDAASTLDARVVANKNALDVINGNGAGSIAAAQAAAEKHADDAITALVDSAPEAMNTLNELAKAINDNKGIYDAYVLEHKTAMAQQKADLQAEIDADVKVEKERAEGKEGELLQAINNEVSNREAADSALEKRIAANETFVKAQPAIDQAQNDRLDVLDGLINNAETGVQKQINDIKADLSSHKTDATTKHNAQETAINGVKDRATQLEGRATKLEADVVEINAKNTRQDERLDALEEFEEGHSHTTMEQGIAANKAAIEQEVIDRNDAIATALEPYSTTEEVKTILGNVVSSLNLSMVNDKVVLKLGGAEGVTLAEVSLDIATDADIDAIIKGLDAE
jgi:hypothetical protein